VAPRGQERIPEAAKLAIEQASGEQVRWNRESIISAIRRRTGLEATSMSLAGFMSAPSTRPASLLDLIGPQASTPPRENSSLLDVFKDITENWPKK
jgi:hypothetical protein